MRRGVENVQFHRGSQNLGNHPAAGRRRCGTDVSLDRLVQPQSYSSECFLSPAASGRPRSCIARGGGAGSGLRAEFLGGLRSATGKADDPWAGGLASGKAGQGGSNEGFSLRSAAGRTASGRQVSGGTPEGRSLLRGRGRFRKRPRIHCFSGSRFRGVTGWVSFEPFCGAGSGPWVNERRGSLG